MTESWQPGDFALCVNDGWTEAGCSPPPYAPRKGQILTVQQPFFSRRYQRLFLIFRGVPRDAWQAEYFVKVTPPRDMIEQERREVVKA